MNIFFYLILKDICHILSLWQQHYHCKRYSWCPISWKEILHSCLLFLPLKNRVFLLIVKASLIVLLLFAYPPFFFIFLLLHQNKFESTKIYSEYIAARRRSKHTPQHKSQEGKVMYWCRDNGIQNSFWALVLYYIWLHTCIHFKRMKLLVNTISEVAKRIISSEPQYNRYLSQLVKNGEYPAYYYHYHIILLIFVTLCRRSGSDEPLNLWVDHEDVAILRLILANTFPSNIVTATVKRSGTGMTN